MCIQVGGGAAGWGGRKWTDEGPSLSGTLEGPTRGTLGKVPLNQGTQAYLKHF